MRGLLKSTDKRRLELIELLVSLNNWITIKEVAQQINSSIRNIQNDLNYINSSVDGLQIETGHTGIRITINDDYSLHDYYRIVLKNALSFQILETIFFHENLSVTNLATKLNVSTPSVYRTIDDLNQYFRQHKCRIKSTPCRIIGDERYIRSFYRTYFKEIGSPVDWPFETLNEQDIDDAFNLLLNTIEQFAKDYFEFFDFAYYWTIKLIVCVNLIRYQHGHLVKRCKDHNHFITLLSQFIYLVPTSKVFQSIGIQNITPALLYQLLYPYYKNKLSFSWNDLVKIRSNHINIDHALTYLEDFLQSLATTIDVDVDIQRLLVMAYGTIYLEDDDPNAHYILNNTNKSFALTLKKGYPHLYDKIYQAIKHFRALLKVSTDDDKIYFIIYTLVIHWHNLFIDIHAKHHKLSVLILSEAHFSHSRTIQEVLDDKINFNIMFETYNQRKISIEALQNTNHDLIISTFKIPDEVDKPVIIIDQYPNNHDIVSILHIVEQLIDKKVSEFQEKLTL